VTRSNVPLIKESKLKRSSSQALCGCRVLSRITAGHGLATPPGSQPGLPPWFRRSKRTGNATVVPIRSVNEDTITYDTGYTIRHEMLKSISKQSDAPYVLLLFIFHRTQCRLYLHWGPGHPQPNGAPRWKVFIGFPLQLIFAKVKAEN